MGRAPNTSHLTDAGRVLARPATAPNRPRERRMSSAAELSDSEAESGHTQERPDPGGIPEATVARLPIYLRALYALAEHGVTTVASDELARSAGVNSAKLRKDLSHLGSYGIRGVGYDVEYLVYQVSRALGLNQSWPVVIIGAGNLGRALANYGGFLARGFRIEAVLDSDASLVGAELGGVPVRHVTDLESVVTEHGIVIGVIAVPAGAAQAMCDRLVAAGVTSILNFAPLVLNVPDGVDVRKVDLSIELQILAFHAQRRTLRAGGGPDSCGSVGGARVSVLVVGLSHKSAPVSVLERAAVSGDTLAKLLHDVALLPDIPETFVISTCNRVEVYAEVGRFHGGVAGVCELLSRYSGIPAQELTSCLYVHYEDRAVQHLLAVSSGLESMVVGEDQILGQVRSALKLAGDHGTLGRSLRDLGRLALRTGKRARAETGIDRLGLSLVSVGIELAAPHPGGEEAAGLPGQEMREKLVSNGPGRLSGLHVLVVGAGAMSGLAVATAARAGAATGTVANRTRAKAERLAAGVGGTVADFGGLAAAIAEADLVISCTGAANLVITEAIVRQVLAVRDRT